MRPIKRLEHLGRRVWLAGLGTLDIGRDIAAKQIDQVMEDSQSLGHQLIDKGAAMAQPLEQRMSNPVKSVVDKLASLNPFTSTAQDQLAQLEGKIDALTELVKALETAPASMPAAKPATKATARKPATRSKTSTARKPAADKASKPAGDASAKPASKSTATKASPAKKPAARKPAATKTAAKTTAKKPVAKKSTATSATSRVKKAVPVDTGSAEE